ncbi:MAG TPA: hypothetical protein VII83_00165 [Gaiellaceae bacterium]
MSAPRTHGARSQKAVSRRAGYVKQAVLKPLALVQRDLSPADRYRLNEWAKAAAIVYLIDAWVSERGLLDEKGRPPGFMPAYLAARNSAARLYSRLEPHLLKAAAEKEGKGGKLADVLGEYRKGEAKHDH